MPWPSTRWMRSTSTEDGSHPQEKRTDQPEEAQRFLGELGEEEEGADIEEPPEVDPRSVEAGAGIAWMLRHRHLLDPEPFAQGQGRYEPVQVSIQRKGLGDVPAHGPHPARHIVETLLRHSPDDAVEGAGLQPVKPAVQPRRATGHHHVGPTLDRVEQAPDPLRLNLKVRR